MPIVIITALNKKFSRCVFVICQVLPIGYRQQLKRNMYLANPQAVNFDRYLKQLEEAVKLYERSVFVYAEC